MKNQRDLTSKTLQRKALTKAKLLHFRNLRFLWQHHTTEQNFANNLKVNKHFIIYLMQIPFSKK